MTDSKIEHYDLAIIGAGVTGLSAAYHLEKSSQIRVALLDDSSEPSSSAQSAGLVAAGLVDNFTRTEQRHGMAHAKASWQYAQAAFDALEAFASLHKIAWKKGRRLRLIATEDEREESAKAVALLREAGFQSAQTESLPQGLKGFLASQEDQIGAAWIDRTALLESLIDATPRTDRQGRLVSFERRDGRYQLQTEGRTLTAEMLVFACHLAIRDFLPGLEAVLVASQDQWQRYQTQGDPLPFAPGTFLSWRHGHYWALIESPHQIVLGGARFLRPLAGFEAKAAELSPKVEAHVRDFWQQHFPGYALSPLMESKALLDIRPCDELPVIGPMFGADGILLGAGYMGQGLSLGFKAGESLAKLVRGEKTDLPRLFWPERHRSLGEDS